jgi:hypothetical protein
MFSGRTAAVGCTAINCPVGDGSAVPSGTSVTTMGEAKTLGFLRGEMKSGILGTINIPKTVRITPNAASSFASLMISFMMLPFNIIGLIDYVLIL